MGVENVPLRAPYIEGEVWGSSLPTEFKGRMSNKMNSIQFPKEPSVSKSTPLHSKAIRATPEEETLMAMRLVRQNVRNVLWITEKL